MKKFVSVLLALAMTFSMATFTAYGEDYLTRGQVCSMVMSAADDYNPDVTKSDVMRGGTDGDLAENRQATKLETFIMMNRAFNGYPELKGHNLRIAIKNANYKDIPQWATEDMSPAVAAGIADGSDNDTFDSEAKVTKTDVEKYLRRVYAIYGTNAKDDYNAAENKTTLENLTIGDGQLLGGTAYQVDELVDSQLASLIEECVSSNAQKGSKEEKIKNLYNNYIDMTARNNTDMSIVKKYLDMAENMKTPADFQTLNETLYKDLGLMLLGFSITSDEKDSTKYITSLNTPDASLQKDVYIGKDENSKNAYISYLENLLILSGEDEATAAAEVNQYFETEKKISAKSLDIAEYYDLSKTYNIYTIDQIDSWFTELDMKKLFEMCGFKSSDKIIVYDKGAAAEAEKLFTTERISDLKNYAKIGIMDFAASYLGEDYIKLSDTFSMEMYGIEDTESIDKKAISLVSNIFDDYVGELYADKYCTEEIEQDVTAIISDTLDVYHEKIDNLDWMSETTKEKAKHKLDTMLVNVGAPDEFEDIYADADIKSGAEGGSYFQNTIEIRKANAKHQQEIFREPVDKTDWVCSPFTVNAFYSPSNNSITFPIAFLQEPAYNINLSYEEKLGRIGAVIGHEISHAFDSSGSQYDENGNAVNWWTDEDKAKFDELCEKVVDYYNSQEWAPGIPVDGELTLTENIADLGGVSSIIALASKKSDFDYKKMFESYTDFWATTYSRETANVIGKNDTHSPGGIRVNRVLQSIDKFYEVYGITESDGMYVPKEERVSIW